MIKANSLKQMSKKIIYIKFIDVKSIESCYFERKKSLIKKGKILKKLVDLRRQLVEFVFAILSVSFLFLFEKSIRNCFKLSSCCTNELPSNTSDKSKQTVVLSNTTRNTQLYIMTPGLCVYLYYPHSLSSSMTIMASELEINLSLSFFDLLLFQVNNIHSLQEYVRGASGHSISLKDREMVLAHLHFYHQMTP